MQRLTLAVASFLGLAVSDRVSRLLDPARVRWIDFANQSSVLVAGGTIEGRPIVIAATDPSQSAGSIRSDDAARLVMAFALATSGASTLVLLLDSAGARLTDGVEVLGGFRRLQRAVLQAAAAGAPVVAVLGRHCFGGASLLACGADHRFYVAGGLFGLSGPKAVLALDRRASPEEVVALYANERRVGADPAGELVPDDVEVLRALLARSLLAPPTPHSDTDDASEIPPPGLPVDPRAFERWFPQGCDLKASTHVIDGNARVDNAPHRVVGLVDGVPVTPQACVRMTMLVRAISREPEATPVILLLDSPGQATGTDEEAAPFSMLLSRLAATVLRLNTAGRRVELWITGQAGGAVYVALAGAADVVVAWPGSRVGTLPGPAIDSVLGGRPPAIPADLVAAGVIDRHAGRPDEPGGVTR